MGSCPVSSRRMLALAAASGMLTNTSRSSLQQHPAISQHTNREGLWQLQAAGQGRIQGQQGQLAAWLPHAILRDCPPPVHTPAASKQCPPTFRAA